jgi:CBS domain-containing protein
MKVSEIMSGSIAAVSPASSIKRAADLMRTENVGFLPVIDGKRLVGVVTDRDIVLRVVSTDKAIDDTVVDDAMTEEVHYCLGDDDVEVVAKRLGELRIRRMPVVDCSGRVTGVISLDDIAVHADWGTTVTEALRRIAMPGMQGV